MNDHSARCLLLLWIIFFCSPAATEAEEKHEDTGLNFLLLPSPEPDKSTKENRSVALQATGSSYGDFPPKPGRPGKPGYASLSLFAILDSLYQMMDYDWWVRGNEPVWELPFRPVALKGYMDGNSASVPGSPDSGGSSSGEEGEYVEEPYDSQDDSPEEDGEDEGDENPEESQKDDSGQFQCSLLDVCLFEAVHVGDISQVQDLLLQGANPNAINSDNETPLMVCARHIHQEVHERILQILIKEGARKVPGNDRELPLSITLDVTARAAEAYKEQGYRMALLLVGEGVDLKKLSRKEQEIFWQAASQKLFNTYLELATPEELFSYVQHVAVAYRVARGHKRMGILSFNLAHLISLHGAVEQLQILTRRMKNHPDQISLLLNTPLRLTEQKEWGIYPLNLAAARHIQGFFPIMLAHNAQLGPADNAAIYNPKLNLLPKPLSFLNKLPPPGEKIFGSHFPGWESALEQIHMRQKNRERGLIDAVIYAGSSPSENEKVILQAVEYLSQTQWSEKTLKLFNRLLHRILSKIQQFEALLIPAVDIRSMRSLMLALGALVEANKNTNNDFDPVTWSFQFVGQPPQPPRSLEEHVYANANWAIVQPQQLPLATIHTAHALFLQFQQPQQRVLPRFLPLNIASRVKNRTMVGLLLAMGECPLMAESLITGPDEADSPTRSDYSVFRFIFGETGNLSLQHLVLLHLFSHIDLEKTEEDPEELAETSFWLERMIRIAMERQNGEFLSYYLREFDNTLKQISPELVTQLTPYMTADETAEALAEEDSNSSEYDYEYSYNSELGLRCPYDRDRLVRGESRPSVE